MAIHVQRVLWRSCANASAEATLVKVGVSQSRAAGPEGNVVGGPGTADRAGRWRRTLARRARLALLRLGKPASRVPLLLRSPFDRQQQHDCNRHYVNFLHKAAP